MAYLLCFIAISKSPVWWCSRKKIRWNQHNELDVHITSQPSHQPQPEEGLWLWRCEGREQQSFYSLNIMTPRSHVLFSDSFSHLKWSKFTLHTSYSLLPGNIRVTLHSFPLFSSALQLFTFGHGESVNFFCLKIVLFRYKSQLLPRTDRIDSRVLSYRRHIHT